MIEAFPLHWPEGWPRRQQNQRKNAPYQVTFRKARDELLNELRLGGGRNVVISSNLALRRDGIPYANTPEPQDPGIAVYWDDRKGQPRVIACDVWSKTDANMRAIGLAYASLRQIERTGASELLERAFAGFARLPEAADCWTILGVQRGTHRETVSERFRELAKQHHPDLGGDAAQMTRITQAYHEAIGATP